MIKVVEAVKPAVLVDYPCVMVGVSDTIVLFNAPKCGTVLKAPTHKALPTVGEYRRDWIMDSFKPYIGTLTLSNQE